MVSAGGPSPTGPAGGLLRNRDFLLLLSAHALSTNAIWIQNALLPWLAYRSAGTGVATGVVVAAQYAPIALLSPLGGVAADRFPRRQLLRVVRLVSVVPPLLLLTADRTVGTGVGVLLVAAALVGCLQVFDLPVRRALLVEAVGSGDMERAVALNTSAGQAAAIIGPALFGVVVTTLGPAWCMVAVAVVYVVIALMLAPVRAGSRRPAGDHPLAVGRFNLGVGFVRSEPVLAALILLVAAYTLLVQNRVTLVPLLAFETLHTNDTGYGILMSVSCLGAVIGALVIAALRKVHGRTHFWFGVGWALSLLALSGTDSLVVATVLIALGGVGQMCFTITALNRIQRMTPNELTGRIVALHSQAVNIAAPVGAALTGVLVSSSGPGTAAFVGGIAGLGVIVLLRLTMPTVFRR